VLIVPIILTCPSVAMVIADVAWTLVTDGETRRHNCWADRGGRFLRHRAHCTRLSWCPIAGGIPCPA
jgi:hypothetical protein